MGACAIFIPAPLYISYMASFHWNPNVSYFCPHQSGGKRGFFIAETYLNSVGILILVGGMTLLMWVVDVACKRIGKLSLRLWQAFKAILYFLRPGLKRLPTEIEALTSQQRAVKEAIAYVFLGKQHYRQEAYTNAIGRFTQAITALEKGSNRQTQDALFYTYNNLGNAYYRNDDYETALVQFQKAAAIYRNQYGDKPDVSFATVLFNIGTAHYKLDSDREARDFLIQALEVHKKARRKPDKKRAKMYHWLGLTCLALEEYKGAIDAFKKRCTIEMAIHKGGPHDAIASAYNCLGNAYYSDEAYEEALIAFKKALHYYQEVYGDNPHEDLANAYWGTGKACYQLTDYTEAIRYFNQAVQVYHAIKDEDEDEFLHKDAICAYSWLGCAYHVTGKPSIAIRCFSRALSLCDHYLEEPHYDFAENNIWSAKSLYAIGKYEQAAKHAKKSFQIFRELYEDKPNGEQANAALLAGKAFQQLDEHERAISYFHQAIEGYQNADATYTEKEADTHRWLGESYYAIASYQAAANHFEDYLTKHKETCTSPCIEIAYVHFKAGVSRYHAASCQEAIAHLRKAIAERRSVQGTGPDTEIAHAYNWIGLAYKQLGEGEGALYASHQEMAIYQQRQEQEGENHRKKIASTYLEIGKAYHSIGSYQKASAAFKQYVAGYQDQDDNEGHLVHALAYNWIGGTYYDLEDYQESIVYFKHEIEAYHKVTGKNLSRQLADAYFSIGKAHYKSGMYTEALTYFQQALEKRKRSGKSEHVAAIYNWIGGTYCALNKYREAVTCFRLELGQYQKAYGYASFNAFMESLQVVGLGLYTYDDESVLFPFYTC